MNVTWGKILPSNVTLPALPEHDGVPGTVLQGIKPESSWCWKADAGSGSWCGVLPIEPGLEPFHQLDMHPSSFPLPGVWVTVCDCD